MANLKIEDFMAMTRIVFAIDNLRNGNLKYAVVVAPRKNPCSPVLKKDSVFNHSTVIGVDISTSPGAE